MGDRYGLDYMDSKRAATLCVLAEVQAGLPAVLVHPTFMIGPQQGARLTSGALLSAIASGRVPGYPSGGKNYVHVADVATATVNALTMGRLGESYILGHENLTYRDAFRLMADVLGVSPPWIALPGSLVKFYGRLCEWQARFTGQLADLNGPMALIACDGHYFNCQKAISELALPQTPLRRAIEDAIKFQA